MSRQEQQQVKLALRHLDGFAVQRHSAACGIDLQLVESKRLLVVAGRIDPPQHRVHASDELGW